MIVILNITVTVTVTVIVNVTVTVTVIDDDRQLVLHDGGSVQRAGPWWSSFGSCTFVEWKKGFNYNWKRINVARLIISLFML